MLIFLVVLYTMCVWHDTRVQVHTVYIQILVSCVFCVSFLCMLCYVYCIVLLCKKMFMCVLCVFEMSQAN